MMHTPIQVIFDFTKPNDARKFLGGLRTADGVRGINCVQLATGQRMEFSTMDDDRAIETASQLYSEWYERGLVIWEMVH